MHHGMGVRGADLLVHFGGEVVLGPLGRAEQMQGLLEDLVFHLAAGEHVADDHQGRARFHEHALQLVVDPADDALFRGANGFGVAFAFQGGQAGP